MKSEKGIEVCPKRVANPRADRCADDVYSSRLGLIQGERKGKSHLPNGRAPYIYVQRVSHGGKIAKREKRNRALKNRSEEIRSPARKRGWPIGFKTFSVSFGVVILGEWVSEPIGGDVGEREVVNHRPTDMIGHVVGILDLPFWDASWKFSKGFASALTSPDESISYKAINNIWVAWMHQCVRGIPEGLASIFM
jgi:hypothetical protein